MPRTDWKHELIAYCEALEDEAAALEGDPAANEHQIGFARGQRVTAKKIRREVGEVFSRWQATDPEFVYGH